MGFRPAQSDPSDTAALLFHLRGLVRTRFLNYTLTSV